jgi:transcription elongation factor Elf1
MKHNFNNKSLMIKNYNKIIDKIKSDSKIKNNSSNEEEMDTINNNLSQDEFSITSNLDSVKKSQNTENIIKTNIENRNESSAKKAEDGMKIINEEEEKKELKDSEYENRISEKEIELIEKSCKSNQSKENDNNSKNFIKGLKYSNFEYSYETHINANNHRHFSFIGPKMNKLKVNDNNLEKKLFCKHCGKKFDSKFGLNAHLNMHKYKCELCYKSFNTKDELMKHYDIESFYIFRKENNYNIKKDNKFNRKKVKMEINGWEDVPSKKELCKSDEKIYKKDFDQSYAFIDDSDEYLDFNKMVKINDKSI